MLGVQCDQPCHLILVHMSQHLVLDPLDAFVPEFFDSPNNRALYKQWTGRLMRVLCVVLHDVAATCTFKSIPRLMGLCLLNI